MEIVQIAAFGLLFGERQFLQRHAMDGPEGFERVEEPQKIVRVHAAGDIHVAGHQGTAVQQGAQAPCNDKVHVIFSEKLRDTRQFFHERQDKLRGVLPLRSGCDHSAATVPLARAADFPPAGKHQFRKPPPARPP